jgi:UDP:flavonoid glycosyltransferase YjiC (YdhE family)
MRKTSHCATLRAPPLRDGQQRRPGSSTLEAWLRPGYIAAILGLDERHLTFGSVAAGTHLPYYPALYRAAIEALAPLAIRILLTVGDVEREIAELGEMPSNVHVETWVPHDDVVRRADVIVCHGGFGSTLGALAHGAPLVVLPLFTNDQWANGETVARAGAGITVADDASERKVLDLPESTTIDELAGAVTSVLEDATYRREAGRVAAAMRALASVDESVRFIEEIAGK